MTCFKKNSISTASKKRHLRDKLSNSRKKGSVMSKRVRR